VRAHNEQRTLRKRGQSHTHQFPKAPLYSIANHRRANRTADYKAYPCLPGWMNPVRPRDEQMSRQQGRSRPVTSAHSETKVFRFPKTRFPPQHGYLPGGRPPVTPRGIVSGGTSTGCAVRHSAGHGPCHDATRGSRGQPGCACAAGNREPSPADGCWAGTYACSLELQGCRSGSESKRCRQGYAWPTAFAVHRPGRQGYPGVLPRKTTAC
jgi:hypothetical protein